MRLAVAPFALLAAGLTGVAVSQGRNGVDAFVLYLASIFCTMLSFIGGPSTATGVRHSLPRLNWRAALPVVALVGLQLALARYFGTLPRNFQHDEFITAYTSYFLPELTRVRWFVGYPDAGLWVCQFPILFFALQKPLLMLLGPTVDGVRMSVWPYLAFTTAYLYLLARELSPRPAFAFLAGLCSIVFAPSIYLSSFGLTFHSSTLFLIGCVYHLLRLLKTEWRLHAFVAGVYCAFAYLTYTASYIALPVVLGFVVLESLVRRSTRPVRLVVPMLAVFSVVMLPFVVSAVSADNYFLQRAGQINSLSGTSYGLPALGYGDSALGFFLYHLAINAKALYEDGHVALQTGYAFGNHALFSPVELGLFALGVVAGLYRAVARAERGYLLLAAAMLAAFVADMVLSMPAGGLHRISLVYPFVGLTIASGALLALTALEARLLRRLRKSSAWQVVFLALTVALCATPLLRAQQMFDLLPTHDSPHIAAYIRASVPPPESVVVASGPGYHLARELFFRTDGRPIAARPLESILKDPAVRVFVLAYPKPDELAKVKETYPGARLVDYANGVRLRYHYVVDTRS